MSETKSSATEKSTTEKRLQIILPAVCVVLFLLPAAGHYLGGPLAVRVAGIELALFLGWISLVIIPVISLIYVYTYEPGGERA